jgi:hypothetical protein
MYREIISVWFHLCVFRRHICTEPQIKLRLYRVKDNLVSGEESVLFRTRASKIKTSDTIVVLPVTNIFSVRFQVLTAASMQFRDFCDVLPCSQIDVDRRFRGAWCLHHQDDEGALMMKEARTSETSVEIYLTTRQYIPDDSELQTFSVFAITKYLNFLKHNPFWETSNHSVGKEITSVLCDTNMLI